MDVQWYVYKNLQVEGPYTWEELSEMVASGTIGAEDLVWENTGLDWKKAASIPGLDYQQEPDANSYQVPAEANKSFFSNFSLKQVVLIMVAVFLFSLSATSLYLYFSREDKEDPDEAGGMFDFDTIFSSDENKQGNTRDDLESTDGAAWEEPFIIEDNSFNGDGSDGSPADSTDQATEETDENGNATAEEDSDYNQAEEETIAWQGGKYTGPLLNEEPHGKGLWRHPDGRNYAGDFEHGKITGYGTMTFAGGEKYVGSFYRGKAHGNGTLVHPGGRIYSGEFKHGVIEGFGTMTFPGGEKYTGYLKNGLAHGKGTMTNPDGESVSGTWTSGKLTEKD